MTLWRWLRALLVIAALVVSSRSVALDKELTESPDFRVRVQAALRLGRQGASSRSDLEQGLKDAHPAVRVACAVGLGNIGDPVSIPPLEAAMRNETYASAKTTMTEQIAKLKGKAQSPSGSGDPSAALDRAKWVVQIGQLRNTSGVRSNDLDAIMRTAAKAKAGGIKGAVVIDGDTAMLQRAQQKQIPVIQLDGTLTKLAKLAARDGVVVSATVDLTIRKIPQQTLKGMVKGNASASADSKASANAITELENRAVGGAMESAMNSIGTDIATLAK